MALITCVIFIALFVCVQIGDLILGLKYKDTRRVGNAINGFIHLLGIISVAYIIHIYL